MVPISPEMFLHQKTQTKVKFLSEYTSSEYLMKIGIYRILPSTDSDLAKQP